MTRVTAPAEGCRFGHKYRASVCPFPAKQGLSTRYDAGPVEAAQRRWPTLRLEADHLVGSRPVSLFLAALGMAVMSLGGQPQRFVAPQGTSMSGSEPPALNDSSESDCATSGTFHVGSARIELSSPDTGFLLQPSHICAWIVHAADTVRHYYGRFPVDAVRIVLKQVDGNKVSGGTTYGQSGSGIPLIVIRLGRTADQVALDRDWVMTHEMVHLSIPSVPDSSHWLEEGIATYVEPIARAQLGQLSPQRVWGDMVAGLPHGMPRPGDRGLEHTPTWGRTYWGGALFCLMADVEIHEQTGNRKGLQDALRGVLAAGGSIQQDWPVARVLEAGDAAVGVPVLSTLYRRMRDSPGPGPDELEALWRQLGIEARSGSVRFVDGAPLAATRRAITAGTTHPESAQHGS